MYDEDDLLPISALQHLVFCPRQWGLIHLEGLWAENRRTAEGHQLHERAHTGPDEARGELRIVRGLRLHSLRLGLVGQADVVEFHQLPDEPDSTTRDPPPAGPPLGVVIPNARGRWQPCPVEYKRGRPKVIDCDRVQLCAQALCLEEMLTTGVPAGAIFYGRTRRRHDVSFDAGLRRETESFVERLHELTALARTPPGKYSQKCENCSLMKMCLPKSAGAGRSARAYLARSLRDVPEGP